VLVTTVTYMLWSQRALVELVETELSPDR
jgi:hypothetical protein